MNISGINTTFTLTDDWARYEITETATGTYVDAGIIQGVVNDFIYMYGAQVEELDYSTSYIPTFNATFTRNQDIVNNAGTSATYNSVEGTLFVEAARDSNDGNNGGFQINDGTSANNIRLFFNQTDTFSVITTVGGVNNVVKTANPITSSTVLNRLAVTWKLNDYKIWANGLQVASDTSAAVYPIGTLNNLDLINQINDYFDGKTSQIQVFNTALSDFDLLNLTSNATSYASYEIMRTSLNFNIQ
jgi:hypothetical protein